MLKKIKVANFFIIVFSILILTLITAGYLFHSAISETGSNISTLISINKRAEHIERAFNDLQMSRINGFAAIAAKEKGDTNEATLRLEEAMDYVNQADKKWEELNKNPSNASDESIKSLFLSYLSYSKSIKNDINSIQEGKEKSNTPPKERMNFYDSYEKYNTQVGEIISSINKNNEDIIKNISTSIIIIISILCVLIVIVWLTLNKTLTKPIDILIENIKSISTGDLTKPVNATGCHEITTLAETLSDMQYELSNTVGNVRDGVTAIYNGAGEIAAGNNDLSSRTEQQAASLEETAASMEELTATVRQNADNARQASHLALTASETAERGGKVVDDVVSTMHGIGDSSKKIADIISVIDGIAFQTNILALNAAVEAARAGEQGRGFAVVAGEVRNLAQRSAQAAREIKTLIEDSVGKVDKGAALVEHAGETMDEIVRAVTRVTDIMSEITSASDEQSRGIDQIGVAVTEMDKVTQQNAALVEQSAAAAASLEDQAGRLAQAVSVFHIQSGELKTQTQTSIVVPLQHPESKKPSNNDVEDWESF
nr:methyl-accepting chemotaxis protein [Morganella morganii]